MTRGERTTARIVQCPICRTQLAVAAEDGTQIPSGARFDCEACGERLELRDGGAVRAAERISA